MITLENVSKRYGEREALAPTTLTMERGQTTVLIGPSGCGKSTLLRLIVGLIAPTTGQVRFDGQPVTEQNAVALRRRMGYVIQDGGLFPHLTAEQNILLMARHLNVAPEKQRQRIAELCALTRFPQDGLKRYPVELSGGQRQRVSLMRALVLSPDVLLLDEPMGALDPMVRAELQTELKDIVAKLGQTVVLVTHDMGEAAYLGQKIVLLSEGQIVQQGTVEDLRVRPAAPFVTDFLNAQRRMEAFLTTVNRDATSSIKDGSRRRSANRPADGMFRSASFVRRTISRRLARPVFYRRGNPLAFAFILLCFLLRPVAAQNTPVVVGSKAFTESYILGEIAKQKLVDAGFKDAQHKQGIGKTIIVWQALQSGAITCYPEYTGTISEEILKTKEAPTLDNLARLLRPLGIGLTGELGFNDTYALVMRKEQADKLHIKTISDLKTHPELNVKVSHEFLGRKDGWKPLVARYGLNMANVDGIEHGLAYEALKNGSIAITDAYSTDAKISEYNLVTLDDDLNYFPQYKAVFLYRLDAPPKAVAALRTLEGKIDARRMTELNAVGERTKNYAQAASQFLGETVETESNTGRFARLTFQHLRLVVLSLFFAILVGVPLGIVASRPGLMSQFILGVVGVLQTIPSLALLALLVAIRPLGISIYTAILALFLYSLLPIVRNTATGLEDIPGPVRESAAALGLEPSAQLRKVFLPIASRTILAGIKTSAIINVGTATLAALIGQGGYGEPIVSGLNLNDRATILEGAIPAAILAVLVQIGFDLLDRVLISPGLRLSHRSQSPDVADS